MKAKTKEIFDRNYAIYRNLFGGASISLEIRDVIFKSMQEYSVQQNAELKEQLEQERKRREAAEKYIRLIKNHLPKEHWLTSPRENFGAVEYKEWQSLVKQSEKP